MTKFKRLTEEDRQLLWKLYFTDGVSSEKIAEQLGVTGPAIRANIRRMGGAIRGAEDSHREHPLNEHAFAALTPEACYWMGVLMTDGCVHDDANPQSSPRVSLMWHMDDIEHIRSLDTFMGGDGSRVHTKKRKNGRTYCCWNARSKILAEALIAQGVTPRKTKTACPSPALQASPDFWRGCWDGDGEVDEGNNCPSLNLVGSFPIIQAFCAYFTGICPEYPLKPRSSGNTDCTAYVNLYGHGAMVLLRTLYEGAVVAMPRKAAVAAALLEKFKDKTFRILKVDIHQREMFPYVYTDFLKAQRDFADLKALDASALVEPLVKGPTSAIETSMIARDVTGVYASHLFHEKVRMSARVRGKPSPSELWGDPITRAKIIEEAENRKHSSLRASMSANCRPCWGFHPATAKAIYQRFGGNCDRIRILDPCAGWGDRLTAALSLDNFGCYLGYDPNLAMAPVYRRIANCYRPGAEATVLPLPFEGSDLPEAGFDVAFTSPPYFDYEEYGDDPGQSYKRYATADAWREGFLSSIPRLCAKALKPGGVLAVNISDAGRAPLVDWLAQEAEKVGSLRFIGTLFMRTGNFNRGMEGIYCWRRG